MNGAEEVIITALRRFSNIRHIRLNCCHINDELLLLMVEAVRGHSSLEELNVENNEVLCNTSSINSIHSSNHVLEKLSISTRNPPLDTLLQLNEGTNKSHVAIRKILHYHPNIDMEPLYAWDSKDDRTLKSLPYIVSWFGRASNAMEDDDDSVSVERRKLLQSTSLLRTCQFYLFLSQRRRQETKKNRECR